ncbi:hypothetical protein PS662_04465 [Pseudomonas fluorescens]|uniref:Iron dicitrate transport regulator FecR n=1 Tax=Pseudomonas fluorescens TaxID=294 RepID=A0A5E6W2X9_PSEFL|nr:FecR domain-containing protein [Pseudomonas fluorescens]VVN22981.1 hypothetical protein PS662_04465 [Pseudomonas fluorescens]
MNRPHDIDSDLPDDNIETQAAVWFVRNREDHSGVHRQAFEQWLSVPGHAKAYHAFDHLWADLAELQHSNKPLPITPRRPSKGWRPALAIAAALVCAVLALNLGTPHGVYQQQIAAQSHGVRTFKLPDGSTLSVNANTRLRVDFNNQQRRLYLEQGQLYLDVAPDKERPLWVHAGDSTVRVVGTGFDVRRGEKQLVVSVAHGQVDFVANSKTHVLLGAQQQASLDLASGALQQQTLAEEQVADWRSGHLAFRNRELASLIDELNLYRARPVLLADPKLGRFKVSGNLDVNDPDTLLNALPALIPVKTVVLADGQLRIEAR